MKKTNHTKLTALLFVIALLCATLTACAQKENSAHTVPESQGSGKSGTAEGGEEKPTLTVLCDFAERNPGSDIHESLLGISGMADYELKIEYVPTQEPDRSNFITRAGIELMSGKGADVFIVDCYMGNLLNTSEGCMFPYPEKAMKNKLFLPLDNYIKDARFTDFDKLLPIVMEAGKNEEGQQILPITYVITASTCLKETYSLPNPLPKTQEDMIAAEDPLLDYMARPLRDNLLMYLGKPADFVKEELSFTEDELFDLAMKYRELEQTNKAGGYDDIRGESGVMRWVGGILCNQNFATQSTEDEVIIVAGPNKTGGITAGISSYGAVNRNTEHQEMAFAVLDKLLSRNDQRSNEMYYLLQGMPMDMEAGNSDNRFMWEGGPWFMNDWNFEQYQIARDRIDSVKFYTPLDREVENALIEACSADDATEDSIRRAVHKTYTTMKMMLAES